MATITKIVSTPASPAAVWDAIRDIGALHTRLVPGFVVATELIPGGRRVTFANGAVIDEPIISSDDTMRRLVWTARGSALPIAHYNGAVQVFPVESGGSRVVWTVDLLPNEMASAIDQMMEQGASAMTRALAQLIAM
jgi:hypothetical protein